MCAHSIWAISLCFERNDGTRATEWLFGALIFACTFDSSIQYSPNVQCERISLVSRRKKNLFAQCGNKRKQNETNYKSNWNCTANNNIRILKRNKHFLFELIPNCEWMCVGVGASIADDREFHIYQWTNVRFCLPIECCYSIELQKKKIQRHNAEYIIIFPLLRMCVLCILCSAQTLSRITYASLNCVGMKTTISCMVIAWPIKTVYSSK